MKAMQSKEVEYKGWLKGFPKEVVEKMLDKQEGQGNKRDVSVFEKNRCSGIEDGGFDWAKTLEGDDFWSNVITQRDFDLFFKRYPKEEGVCSEHTDAKSVQIGGSHYKGFKIQPIEFIQANDLSYCQGNIIKYILRDKGNRVEDLEKAKHYIDLIIEDLKGNGVK